ncbi:MAG: hypothetical protein K8R90_09595 [Candidatus Cloacimonetes bacterium]|nr:hypothetical protein [Candidatus Cloacimonadota bacterium]
MKIAVCLIGLACLLLTACSSVKVLYTYDYSLVEPQRSGLSYTDSLFIFSFTPTYNGILFKVHNRTEKPTILLWDYTYFITPDGNTYNALHTDLLEANLEAIVKAKYQSIIPPGGQIRRFTTPISNISCFSYDAYKEYTIALLNTSLTFADAISYEYYLMGNYYPVTASFKKTEIEAKLNQVSIDFCNERQVGIGMRIAVDEKEYDYLFMFQVDTIHAHVTQTVSVTVDSSEPPQRKTITQEYITGETLQNWYIKDGEELTPAFE